MARIRSVKPGFFKSLDIADLQRTTRLHFIGLWTYADDLGRGIDDPRLLKADLWPLDDDVTTDDIERFQDELSKRGRIVRYTDGSRDYFQVVNWPDHQRPNRPQESKLPGPEDESVNPHEPFTERSVNAQCVDTEGSSPERISRGEERSTPDGDGGTVVDGEPFGRKLALELKANHGVEFMDRDTLRDAYRDLLDHALKNLPTGRHRGTAIGVIAEFVERGQGLAMTREARSHTARLVNTHDPAAVLDAFGEALDWGAGIPPQYASDALALSKYVAGVLSKRKARS